MAQPEKQDMDELRKRFDDLRDRRTTTEANLKYVEERLEKLRKDAREKYGTDDPAELQKRLDALRAENEKKRSDYQSHLDEIDGRLKALEKEDSEA